MTREFPITLTFEGADPAVIRLDITDGGPFVDLTPDEARALAADLESLADEWDAS